MSAYRRGTRQTNININEPETQSTLNKKKSNDSTFKVILGIFGIVLLLFIMFSVYTPKNSYDKPPKIDIIKTHKNNVKINKDINKQRMIPIDDDDQSDQDISIKDDNNDLDIIEDDNGTNNDDKVDTSSNKDEINMDNDGMNMDYDEEYLNDIKQALPPKSELYNDKIDDTFIDKYITNINVQVLPSLDENNKIYIMNSIYLPRLNFVTIHALTGEYLKSSHGLHAWPGSRGNPEIKKIPQNYREISRTIIPDYKKVNNPFKCLFLNTKTSQLYVSQVKYVPNNTTRDRYVNYASEIFMCALPSDFKSKTNNYVNKNSELQFIFTQQNIKDISLKSGKLVHTKLNININIGSSIELLTHKNDINSKGFISLCMPPMSEPLTFITENIAHHLINMKIDHIIIGVKFYVNDENIKKGYTIKRYYDMLMERLQPFFNEGQITIWPHEQPYIQFTDKAKSHWLNQCLYYVKDRYQYTLSLDADEFVLLNDFESGNKDALKDLVLKTHKNGNEYCWTTFKSVQMWKLMNPNEQYMVKRFIGRETKAQLTWSKVIWNNKHLWYTGYHAGGSCTVKQHDWNKIVYDWREQIDKEHVYRFDDINEGKLFHYYNSRFIRIEPNDKDKRNPWSKTYNDDVFITKYWDNIQTYIKDNPSFPDNDFDVMNTDYYIKHYGKNKSQEIFIP